MSSPITYLAELLRENGWTLLIGTTLVLSLFAALVHYSRSTSTKNMLASTAMLAVLAYLVVAIVPMPRFGFDLGSAPTTPNAQPDTPAILPAIADSELLFAHRPDAASDPTASAAARNQTPVMPSRGERMASSILTPEVAPATANDAAAASIAVGLPMWLAAAFALGSLFFAGHLLLGWVHLRRLLHKSQRATNELKSLIKLPARTRLRIVNASVQPFCCGLLRPTIVLPKKLAHPTDETRFVLLHERAHLTSGDTRARLLSALLRPLLFWHPLYWWLHQKLRFTSELLADDAAAQGSVADYVRCMMTLSTHPDPATGGALVATIFRRKSELFRRLEMMLQRDEAISRSHSPLIRWTRNAATIALIALCAGTFGVENAVAQAASGQSPGNSQVRAQVRQLKAELARLRTEITALRDTEKSTLRNVQFGRLDPATGKVTPASAPVDPAEPPSPPTARFPRTTAPAAIAHTRDHQEPEATSAPRPSRRILYKVQKGDTLARIAQKHLGSSQRYQEILRSNPKIDPAHLRVGQQLTIPLSTARVRTTTRKNDQLLPAPRAVRANDADPVRVGSRRVRAQHPEVASPPRANSTPAEPAAAPRPNRRGARNTVRGTRRPPQVRGRRSSRSVPGVSAPQNPAAPSPAKPSVASPKAIGFGGGVAPTTARTRRPSRNAQEPAPPGPTAPRAHNGHMPTPPGPTAPRSRRSPGATSLPAPADVPSRRGPSAGGPSAGGPSSRGPSAGGPSANGPSAGGPGVAISSGGGFPGSRSARTTGRAPRSATTVTTGGVARMPRATSSNRQAPASSLGGLADLVTRCIELRGDVEIQEVNVRHARSKKEQEIAKIRLRTKRSQFEAIESMLKQELATAQQRHQQAKKLHANGFVTTAEVQATESKLALLMRALR